MKGLLVLLLVGMVCASGCFPLEDATRTGSVLMTRRVNQRIDPLAQLTAEQEEAFGNAFFDQCKEDYRMVEDLIKGE